MPGADVFYFYDLDTTWTATNIVFYTQPETFSVVLLFQQRQGEILKQ